MSPLQSLPSLSPIRRRSEPVFVQAGLLSAFNLKRAAYFLMVPMSALGICAYLGHGVLGLALMTVTSWPFPPRCHVERGGLRFSWLLVNERVPWSEIVAVELRDDQRRSVVGKRPRLLVIERSTKSRITLSGRAEVLERLAGELTPRFKPQGIPRSPAPTRLDAPR